MKLPKVPCALILVLILAAFVSAEDAQPDRGGLGAEIASPALAVDEVTHDFGEVRPGRALRWTFKVKNVGNADLLIYGVAPG